MASEEAKTSAVCEPTREAREAHVRALIDLRASDVPQAITARRTGVIAMSGVAAGCDEVKQG